MLSIWLAALVALPLLAGEATPPRLAAGQRVFDFGKVRKGVKIMHEFPMKNEGAGRFEISGFEHTVDVLEVKMRRFLPSGATGQAVLELDTQAIDRGPVEASVIMQTNDPALPELTFTLKGEVEPIIDVQPHGAVFLSAWRGETAEQSVRIVNHDSRPLAVKARPSSSERFTWALDTVRKGREYLFKARLRLGVEPGKSQAEVVLDTGHPEQPLIKIQVHTFVKDFVYADPDRLDFGLIDKGALSKSPDLAALLSRPIFVRRKAKTDFQLEARSDLPFIEAKVLRGSSADTLEVRLAVLPDRLLFGPFRGTITISTSDQKYPRLDVPVKGVVR